MDFDDSCGACERSRLWRRARLTCEISRLTCNRDFVGPRESTLQLLVYLCFNPFPIMMIVYSRESGAGATCDVGLTCNQLFFGSWEISCLDSFQPLTIISSTFYFCMPCFIHKFSVWKKTRLCREILQYLVCSYLVLVSNLDFDMKSTCDNLKDKR